METKKCIIKNPEFIQKVKKIEGREFSTIYPYSFPNRTSIQDIIQRFFNGPRIRLCQNFKLKMQESYSQKNNGQITVKDIRRRKENFKYSFKQYSPQEQ
jgi:hypothetical protein